jgi:hypothetical protein
MSSASDDDILERVRVREVAGVFDSREALDAAVQALLRAGFDRADIDLMATADAIEKKLGGVYIAAEELPDVPGAPRRAYVAREDLTVTTSMVAGVLSYFGATAAALAVVASGGALAAALAAAVAGGAIAGGIGAVASRLLGREQAKELETQMALGGLVLWVRVRSPEHEERAQQILNDHGAKAVRVHHIEIAKRLEDIPLSSIRPDPWLGDERLGDA